MIIPATTSALRTGDTQAPTDPRPPGEDGSATPRHSCRAAEDAIHLLQEVNAAARQSDRRNIGCLLPKALYLFTELLKIFSHFIRIIVSVRSNQF